MRFSRTTRRHGRWASHANLLSLVAVVIIVATSGAAAASVGSDRTQIAQLQQQIADQGVRVKSLVSRYDAVQAHLDMLQTGIASQQMELAHVQRSEAAARATLQSAVVNAYMTGDASSPVVTLFSAPSSASGVAEQINYLDAVTSKWNDALTSLQLEQNQVETTQHALNAAEAQAHATLVQLARARDDAMSAISSDTALLTRVNGNLQSLLIVEAKQREAAQQSAERALATTPLLEAAPAAPTTQPPPNTSPRPANQPPPTPGLYANPLRDVRGLTPERIDMGVDYIGFGPIYAIGDGIVLTTVGNGWPGGTFIAYQLLDGPARGFDVYVAEDIAPAVQPGQHVTTNTVLGQAYVGPDGIETGWADGARLPNTMARDFGQFDGNNSTAFGNNFSQLMQLLGGPGGHLISPPVGALPPGWPHW